MKVVIKVVQKTSLRNIKLSILPINVNYMVNLKRYYETDEVLILVLDYIAPGCLFYIIHPYLIEKSSKFLTKVQTGSLSVIKTDPEFIKNQTDSISNEDEEKLMDEDIEIVYNLHDVYNIELSDDDDEEDEELLCINQAGMETIKTIDKDRFQMLEDHTNEIIAKRLDALERVDLNKLTPNRLLTPALSSAPISVPTSTTVSPLSRPGEYYQYYMKQN